MICEVVVFLSGERTPFFLITLFTVLLIIYIPEFRIYRIIGVVITIILILGAIELNPSAKKRMIDYSLVQLSETKLPFLPFSKAHEEHYISALKMFKDSPVFGVGTNTYRFKSWRPEYDSKTHDINSHPHNFYFQVLAELGIFGFLFLGTFFMYLSLIGLRQLKFIFISGDKKNYLLSICYFL